MRKNGRKREVVEGMEGEGASVGLGGGCVLGRELSLPLLFAGGNARFRLCLCPAHLKNQIPPVFQLKNKTQTLTRPLLEQGRRAPSFAPSFSTPIISASPAFRSLLTFLQLPNSSLLPLRATNPPALRMLTISTPSTSPRLPRLPFELLSQIIKEVPREDLPSLHATCRTFREVSITRRR